MYTKEFVSSLITIRETYGNQTTELWDRIKALKIENEKLRETISQYEAPPKDQNNVESILCNSVH